MLTLALLTVQPLRAGAFKNTQMGKRSIVKLKFYFDEISKILHYFPYLVYNQVIT